MTSNGKYKYHYLYGAEEWCNIFFNSLLNAKKESISNDLILLTFQLSCFLPTVTINYLYTSDTNNENNIISDNCSTCLSAQMCTLSAAVCCLRLSRDLTDNCPEN